MFILKSNIFILAFCSLVFVACSGLKPQTFNEDKHLNDKFFSKIISTNLVPDPIKIELYETIFIQRLTEQDGIIDFAVQNQITTLPYVTAIPSYADQQHLFLANIQGEKKNMWVYFSVKYKPGKESPSSIVCKSFGPAYFSTPTASNSQIRFSRELQVTNDNSVFVLCETGKAAVTFITTGLPSLSKPVEYFDITQIIEEDANKIGGNKYAAFNIPKIFGDTTALRFRHCPTIYLKN
ncbi:hypothetical protein [Pinibacter aurantiacus]|uniref:Lipoprotein n=1 Tax=Pinibacter aurantiacus TaxID=2851599 RepID=A0A9E2S631_9BACT|nr:hypothetical protein [Pinibacter aurantiacus]MBV4355612.1 hypothetical protein [Pinibacter aurantiacus]